MSKKVFELITQSPDDYYYEPAPEFMFEEIEELDKSLLNKWELGTGECFNKQYILDLWEHQESLTINNNWDIRFDTDKLKCWTSKNGSKFDKDLI